MKLWMLCSKRRMAVAREPAAAIRIDKSSRAAKAKESLFSSTRTCRPYMSMQHTHFLCPLL